MRTLLLAILMLVGVCARLAAESTEARVTLLDPNTGEPLGWITVDGSSGTNSGESIALDPALQVFLAHFLSAIKAKDRAAIEAMEHSGSRACHTDANRDYLDAISKEDLKATVAPDNQLSIEAIGKDDALLTIRPNPYPVHPSHRLHVFYDKETSANGWISVKAAMYHIVREGNSWAYVAPCPSE